MGNAREYPLQFLTFLASVFLNTLQFAHVETRQTFLGKESCSSQVLTKAFVTRIEALSSRYCLTHLTSCILIYLS